MNRSFNNIEEPRRSQLQHQLLILMTTYCAKYDVAYWQGMHDIIATMLLFEPQPPLERIFLLFSAFLQTFIPNPVKYEECILLKHIFEMIRLLLQYHDPRSFSFLFLISRIISISTRKERSPKCIFHVSDINSSCS